jgi:hypothetical protein
MLFERAVRLTGPDRHAVFGEDRSASPDPRLTANGTRADASC